MSGARELMASEGVTPRKSKGQNFLTDGRVADRIVGYAGIRPGDRVLEVGPGFGILTERLVEAGGSLACIEVDPKLAAHVRSAFGDRLELIEGDAVKVPFPEFDVFVSNLPYSVSTPIIFKLLESDFRTAVVMVQKEFADRMVADVGSPDYSRLTVNLFYRAECEVMEPVPASRFDPRPKVDSAVVRMAPRPAPFEVLDEATFFRVTEACFNHRRKKVGTSLKTCGLVPSSEGVPYKDERIEDLRPAEIGEVADAVFSMSQRLRLRRPSGMCGVNIQRVVFRSMKTDLIRRYIVFFIGISILSLGVGIITKGNLGTSPITSIPYSLSMIFSLSIGEFTILYSFLLVTIQGALLWKLMDKTSKFNLAMEYVFCIVFGYLVDLFMAVLEPLNPTDYWLQVVTVLVGILVLAFGVYLQVVAGAIMAPGDGFAYAITLRTRWSYGKVRVISDSSMVIVAAVIGLIGLGTLGGVREGTVLCCILTGLTSKQYMKRFGKLTSLLVPGENLDEIADGEQKHHEHAQGRGRHAGRPHADGRGQGRQEGQGRERRYPRPDVLAGGRAGSCG